MKRTFVIVFLVAVAFLMCGCSHIRWFPKDHYQQVDENFYIQTVAEVNF